MTSPLFKPFQCRGLSLPNRIVMAPMTRSFSPGGIPTDDVAAYYERRAAADVGLILTEGVNPDRPAAGNDPKAPKFYGDEALAAWKTVADKVHQAGGKIAPQLWHVGMMRKPGTGHNPDAVSDGPSGLTHTGKSVQPAATDEEIADMIASYARAAKSAKDLGFDAIEIHAAHGYLIDQFFWDVMNAREDKYGGGLTQRATFAADVIKAVRKAVGEDMPVIMRYSQWKQQDFTVKLAQTPQELEAFLSVFVDAGLDMLHCSQRRFWEPEFEGSDLNLAGWSKKLTGLPTISVGSVGLTGEFVAALGGENSDVAPLDELIERMERDEFDLIAVGRALLQDYEWVSKVKEGRFDELKSYDASTALLTLN